MYHPVQFPDRVKHEDDPQAFRKMLNEFHPARNTQMIRFSVRDFASRLG
jgi:hypothetical protein